MSEAFTSDTAAKILHGVRCFVEPCGSRVTCNPAPKNTDADFLVELIGADSLAISKAVNTLSAAGFEWEGNEHYQQAATNGFMSWRKGEINLIVSADVEFVRRHRAATSICKSLNLLRKSDRVAVFQAVLYGNEAKAEGKS